jgi:hypothetical protein
MRKTPRLRRFDVALRASLQSDRSARSCRAKDKPPKRYGSAVHCVGFRLLFEHLVEE